jgi:para-nitrobenzyl esterase
MAYSRSLAPSLALALPLSILAAAGCGSGNNTTSTSGSTGGSTATSGTTTSGTTSSSTGGPGGAASTLVQTDKGPVQGIVVGSTREFLGIPFAAPPIGPLRWKSPQPAAAWTTAIDASKVGPECAQLEELQPTPDPASSEDCLTLNVWTPSKPAATPAPVMVWIFGGGFVTGNAGDPAYDGQALSEATGAVIVTVNYRLGPLGFLAHTALTAEDPSHPSSGMYGFEDQRAALAWVKTNIAAFGGDPSSVALFGESAGGISTCLHLISPLSDGLFQRTMIESGPCDTTGVTLAAAEAQGTTLATAVGCTDASTVLTCMRAVTSDAILTALPLSPDFMADSGTTWFPIVDGLNITDQPPNLFAAGSFSKTPTLLGTNKNEGSIFFLLGGLDPTTDAEAQALFEASYPGQGAAIEAMYPSSAYGGSADAAAIDAFGDSAFVCPTRRAARALSKGGVPVYLYQFTHAVTSELGAGVGVFHSSEIPFIWGNPYLGITLDAQEKQLSTEMMDYWFQMAASGDPTGKGAFAWPAYEQATDTNIVLDLTLSTETGLKSALCDFWDGLAP